MTVTMPACSEANMYVNCPQLQLETLRATGQLQDPIFLTPIYQQAVETSSLEHYKDVRFCTEACILDNHDLGKQFQLAVTWSTHCTR